jgi:hypothetical protein
MQTTTALLTRISLLVGLLLPPLHVRAAEFESPKVQKGKDKVTVEVQAERAAFTVVSSDGIGKFTVALKSGHWPRDVSIIVNRKGLENFELVTDRIRATGAVTSGTNCWCSFDFRNMQGEVEGRDGAGSLRVSVKGTKDGVEISFPRNLFSDTKQFSFAWIDAYRH